MKLLDLQEADIVQPKKKKVTPKDAIIQIPDMGTMSHEAAQKKVVAKLEDMITKAKRGNYYQLKKQQLNILLVMWETLAKHQGDF